MAVNRSTVACLLCTNPIPPLGGNDVEVNGRVGFAHLACIEAARKGEPMPVEKAGDGQIINRKGRCIDAPACGCCGTY